MNKILFCIIFLTGIIFGNNQTQYSTVSVVTLVGGAIRASADVEQTDEKHKRKDCPVCKGKGWYMSGDGIKKIECQYCEEENAN